MQIIGHRGARGLAPMNTKAAIKTAIKEGVDWVEFDVRCTKDGKVILMHDFNSWRTTIKPLHVAKSKSTTLLKAKTYSGQPITTITDAFAAIGGKAKINIEIKSKGCAEIIVDHIERMIKAGAPYSHFLVSSFKTERLREIHRLNAQIPLALLHGINPKKFLEVKALRLSAVGFWRKRVSAAIINQAKIRRLPVYVYTVNNLKLAESLHQKGVDRIVTDRPDLMQQIRSS